jgi:hypothetical protein
MVIVRFNGTRRGGTGTTESSVNLADLSDGELLDLAVQTEASNRRILVIWLFLRERPQSALEEFDHMLTSLAEKELQRRADSMKAEK